jgi:hypothetical protein
MTSRALALLASLLLAGCPEAPAHTPDLGQDMTIANPDMVASADMTTAADMAKTADMIKIADMTVLPTGSCDQRTAAAPQNYCQEYEATQQAVIDAYKGACAAPATWLDAACPRTGSLGGCRTYDAGLKLTTTNWFFVGGAYNTPADVMSLCGSGYVAP